MKTNQISHNTVQYKVLSDSQIEEILSNAYNVLGRVGVEINDREIIKLLKDAGCIVKDKRVFIPSYLIHECLELAPKKITVSNRDGDIGMLLEENSINYGTGSDLVFILDSYTGERRQTGIKDVEDATKISDSLKNIDFHMSLAIASDVPKMTYDRYQFLAMLKNTKKPLVLTAVDGKGIEDIYNMCCIIKDGEDNFKLKPFVILYIEAISPLVHPKTTLEKIKFTAKKGIPTIYTSAAVAGATAPVTLAGTITMGVAEYLSGVVIAQLIQKGAPVIGGGTPMAMDMNSGVVSYGSREFHIMSAATTQITRYLGLPVFSTSGCSSSKLFDGQATMEAMYSIFSAALSGANVIHDNGYIEDGLCASFEMLVLCDEIIEMVKKYISGVEINKNTLAFEVIEKVGPGGNFLIEDHTLKNFRNEIYFPSDLIDRRNYQNWKNNGSKSIEIRVNERVKNILENYQPEQISSAKLEKLEKYMKNNVK